MCEKPDDTWEQDHRRLVQLAAKDEPTDQDLVEANKVLLKTQNDICEKVAETARGYSDLYKTYSSRANEGSTQIETFQKRNNTLNWGVLTSLRDGLTVTLEYEELAKEVEDHVGGDSVQTEVGTTTEHANKESGSVQVKAGVEPRDKDDS